MSQDKVWKFFFIYSANPPDVSEAIENSIDALRKRSGTYLDARGWKDLGAAGQIVFGEVSQAIDDADLVVCDLSVLSMNVLFELGYSIAKGKRVWLCVRSYGSAKTQLKGIRGLSTFGYAKYTNSDELVGRLLREHPYDEENQPLLKNIAGSIANTDSDASESDVFYMKCPINSEASVLLTRLLENAQIPVIRDDPDEVSTPSLAWYIQTAYSAHALAVHFAGEDINDDQPSVRNANYALVAGIAYGFEKPVLMLAHQPFASPVDFRDLLSVHKTAKECCDIAGRWLAQIKREVEQKQRRRARIRSSIERQVGLQRIALGQYVAENEADQLPDYFVDTAPYLEALKASQHMLYVGRKGAGKTANFYQVAEALRDNKRNHVCLIKPVDYEMEGLVSLLSMNMNKASPGYLTESIWKFLLYTELAASVYHEIAERPPYLAPTETESAFLTFVDTHRQLVLDDFSERMESMIKELCQIDSSDEIRQDRIRISEVLHVQLLAELRERLGQALVDREKVVILVDNLDKAWRQRENLELLSDFLFGLLSASQNITEELRRDRARWRSVNISLLVFLRSDIFSYIRRHAREGDKIAFQRINWSDARLLQRVIEERFINSIGGEIEPSEVWTTYFQPVVHGDAVKDYICSRIVPRPRDIIFLCRDALTHAINRGHDRILEDDLDAAGKAYSEHAFNSLLTETEVEIRGMEELLYEFAGQSVIVTEHDIRRFAKKAGIPDQKLAEAVESLVEHSFLALETAPGEFQYVYEQDRLPVLARLSDRVAAVSGQRRYRIGTPFHPYLEIKESDDSPLA